MTLKIKLLHPNARMPEYKTSGASGMDLYAVEETWLRLGETSAVRIGIAVELPDGYEAQIRPRSSMSKLGVCCHTGTIDHDYRGELSVVLSNLGAQWWGDAVHILPGDRIAQLVIEPVARVEVVKVDELSETVRGNGGFGSTGR